MNTCTLPHPAIPLFRARLWFGFEMTYGSMIIQLWLLLPKLARSVLSIFWRLAKTWADRLAEP
jgi:hypothetical protein